MTAVEVKLVRAALAACGGQRQWLAAQEKRLRHDTTEALERARRVGIPTSDAARLAGLSRSSAYLHLARGGDDAAHHHRVTPAP